MVKKVLPILILFVMLLNACQNLPLVQEGTSTPFVVEIPQTPTTSETTIAPEIESSPTISPTATTIPEYDMLSPEILARLQVVVTMKTESPVSMTWSADSKKLGVLSVNGFSIFSAENGALLKSIVLSDPYRLLDASISRELVAVTTDQQSVEFRSMDTGDVVSTLTPDELFLSGSFHPDGYEFLLTSGYDIAAEIWDIEANQLVNTIDGFETAAPVYNARFNDQANSLIWTARGTVQVYDLQTGEFGAVMGHEDFVSSSDLAPNGKMLAAASLGTVDGNFRPIVRLWDAYGGQILGDIPNGDMVANAVHFSPDGTMLLFADSSGVSIWLVQGQNQLWQLPAQGSPIRDARFSPDNKAIALVDDDGNLQILRAVQMQY
jgi:WD40 repeat protein